MIALEEGGGGWWLTRFPSFNMSLVLGEQMDGIFRPKPKNFAGHYLIVTDWFWSHAILGAKSCRPVWNRLFLTNYYYFSLWIRPVLRAWGLNIISITSRLTACLHLRIRISILIKFSRTALIRETFHLRGSCTSWFTHKREQFNFILYV